jgi:UDP-glucuronate decarboxylase
MRILVTGGAGFIGKHLCRRLMSDGHEVWSLDIAYEWESEKPGYRCVRKDIDGLHCRRGTVLCGVTLRQEFQPLSRLDRIYHLACHASPKRYQEDPLHTIRTCVTGTDELLQHIQTYHKQCRIILASTSEIYGEPEVHPQPESYRGNVNCLGPRACYDEGKRMAECLMMDYHRQYGVDTRIARIFNTYGPGMDFDDGRVISNFVTQALKGEPLTIYGDGSQTRSFCYIDEMVEGLIRLMEYEGEECHEPCNLGNPEEWEIGHIAGETSCQAGILCPFKVAYLPLPQDDPTRRCPDITRAKRNLGWEPKVSLSEGLRRTVEDFRERMKANAVVS